MSMSSKFISLIMCFCFVASCAKTNEEEVSSAIREARFLLNSGECSKAQDVLDDVDPGSSDANFVSVKASAIACEADYTDTRAVTNLRNIDTSTLAFLGSFAAFPTSNETAADQKTYTKIIEAIDYLLKADGGATPSTSNRLVKFGKNKGNDLSMQLFFMSTVALGKFVAFYGNTDSVGVKGNGSAGNGCLAHYVSDGQMDTDLGNDNGGANQWASCDSGTDGHIDLETAVTVAVQKRRMCEGVVLVNNIFDVLLNIDLSSNSTVENLDEIRTVIDTIYNGSLALAAIYPSWSNGGAPIINLRSVTSQSECENFSLGDLEIFYLLFFEAYLQ